MRNEEIITRLNEIKRRAKSQKRDQCVTIILTPDGFVKMFDANGTVKKGLSIPIESITGTSTVNNNYKPQRPTLSFSESSIEAIRKANE